MKFRKLLTHAGMAAAAVAGSSFLADPAAADPAFLVDAESKADSVWQWAKTAIYYGAAFGNQEHGVNAFFGKFKWMHLVALAGGVILVAGADLFIQMFGGTNPGL